MIPLNLQGRVIRAINSEIRAMSRRKKLNFIRYESVLAHDEIHQNSEGSANLAREIYEANRQAALRPPKFKKL